MTKVRHNIPLLLVAGLVLLGNLVVLVCGIRKRRDGWRNATGLVLRGEASMFVLSAFGLNAGLQEKSDRSLTTEEAQSRIAERLYTFFAGEPACRVRIIDHREESTPEHTGSPCYTLGFLPWIDGPERFIKPTDWCAGPHSPFDATREAPNTSPLFNTVCRIGPRGECDLWLRINHVGADGVPMQEMLTRLESAWGSHSLVLFPTPEDFEPYAQPRPSPGRDDLAEVQFFADFGPLLRWRERENRRLDQPMTVAAAILWQLAKMPEFHRLRLATTVDMPASDEIPRGVAAIVCNPAVEQQLPHPHGLAHYVQAFNRVLTDSRRRKGTGCVMLDAAAFLPPSLAKPLLRFALTKASRTFGSAGLTMIKDARVFGAPIAEVGHNRGFMAIGSLSLPCTDGRPGGVGCITAKAASRSVGSYPRLIRQAIESCKAEHADAT